MNTVIPFIDELSPTADIQSGIIWVTACLLGVLIVFFVAFAVRSPKHIKFWTRLLAGFSALFLFFAWFLWVLMGFIGAVEELHAINASTIEKIEENLDVDLQFADDSIQGISCSSKLEDRTIDAVTVVRDSNRFLVSLSASKNDDGTCTYELTPYENTSSLLESTDKK